MADYQTQFSRIFNVGSAENAEKADDIRDALAAKLDRHDGRPLGFVMAVDHEHGPGALWLSSNDYGEPDHVTAFVLRCAEAFDVAGLWGFTWATSCSPPCLDGFGGGALVIDLRKRERAAWIDCNNWLAKHITRDPVIAAGLAAGTSDQEMAP